jgi:copper chaperone CopZ
MGMTQTLHVVGMTCGGCENAVKRAVGKLPGVVSVEASHSAQKVTIDFDGSQTTLDAVKAKIAALGYQVAGQA